CVRIPHYHFFIFACARHGVQNEQRIQGLRERLSTFRRSCFRLHRCQHFLLALLDGDLHRCVWIVFADWLQVDQKSAVVQRRDHSAKQIHEVFVTNFLCESRVLQFSLVIELSFDDYFKRLVQIEFALVLQIVCVSRKILQHFLVDLILIRKRHIILLGSLLKLLLCFFRRQRTATRRSLRDRRRRRRRSTRTRAR